MGTTSKALSLLRLFSSSQPEIGLTELSRQSGMNKATVYRLMSDLAEHGFVEQVGADRMYRIGPGIMRLAVLREATVPLRSIAKSMCAPWPKRSVRLHMCHRYPVGNCQH